MEVRKKRDKKGQIADVLSIIKTRRSVRRFTKEKIGQTLINKIIEAGRWAPSGLNNQPWRFMIRTGAQKDAIAQFTRYGDIIAAADCAVLVFLDKKASYHREKDFMAIGACIQNMLLAAHFLGCGACWLGEIVDNKEAVHKHLRLGKSLELAAVITIGRPLRYPKRIERKTSKELLILP